MDSFLNCVPPKPFMQFPSPPKALRASPIISGKQHNWWRSLTCSYLQSAVSPQYLPKLSIVEQPKDSQVYAVQCNVSPLVYCLRPDVSSSPYAKLEDHPFSLLTTCAATHHNYRPSPRTASFHPNYTLKPSGHYMYHQFNIQQFYVLPTQTVFMCFVWIWEQTAIISLYSITWLVCITETECVYCAVRTGS